MVEPVKFFNVQINVDGKVHNVKVEKGVFFETHAYKENDENYYKGCTFHPYGTSVFKVNGDNSISELAYRGKKVDAEDCGNEIHELEYKTQIDMTKAQFALFKNVADNVKEDDKDNTITLSAKDIDKAEELFRAGKFTEDISKNIPEGYDAYMGSQYLYTNDGQLPPFIEAQLEIDGETYGYDNVAFYYGDNTGSQELMEAAENSIDNKVIYDAHADIGEWYFYTDKNGVTHGRDFGVEEDFSIEYDEDGKHIHKNLEDKIETITYTTEEGKEIEEIYYNLERKNLKRKTITYKKEDGNNYSMTKENFYKEGKIERTDIFDDSMRKSIYYDDNGKVMKTSVQKDGYKYVYENNTNKLTVYKGKKPLFVKQGDKTTHYMDGKTMEQYILDDLRGE